MSKKYSDEDLKNAVATSFSVMEVMRKLNMKMAGGSHTHISGRIKKANLDKSHFLGKKTNAGFNKKSPEQILIFNPNSERREKASRLSESLKLSGIKHVCAKCGLGNVWNDSPITLHVDHIDGNWKDNRLQNLRFLCPNCHSQTITYGNKKRIKAGVGKLVNPSDLESDASACKFDACRPHQI